MSSSDLAKVPGETPRRPAAVHPPLGAPPPLPPPPPRSAPARPTLAGKPAAPVIVKKAPPVSVRFAQLFTILSLVAGAAAIVYLFVIRETQLPAIEDSVREVDASRSDSTYTATADILYWTLFGALVLVLLVQLTTMVAFNNRRPHARWWHLSTILTLAVVTVAGYALVAIGDRGMPLVRILALQFSFAVLALLCSLLPPAMHWSARRHDVRSTAADVTGGDL